MDEGISIPAPTHDEASQRFEVKINGELCWCDYRLAGSVMQLIHTEVAPALQGHGIAGRLVQAAVDHARAQGLQVQPRCSYVRAYLNRHPETHDLLA